MKQWLTFLRITDPHDGLVSLTNLALWVVLVKIAAAGEVTLTDAGALFVTLLSYQGKKVINKGETTSEQIEALNARINEAQSKADAAYSNVFVGFDRIDELSSKVTQQQMAMGIKELRK
ncbi:hypothetical protein UFOVP1351_11 [uncultured Caudovirales phage]|uniref:Uncharacterized protein n=1 Tax=uncultured Caudovirales phage TaxID=2100421 RepID=A0A6J5RV40_9CAUD|nr:hypothetical protein UFOVP1351_11 [uncultured Caudovirales phage]